MSLIDRSAPSAAPLRRLAGLVLALSCAVATAVDVAAARGSNDTANRALGAVEGERSLRDWPDSLAFEPLDEHRQADGSLLVRLQATLSGHPLALSQALVELDQAGKVKDLRFSPTLEKSAASQLSDLAPDSAGLLDQSAAIARFFEELGTSGWASAPRATLLAWPTIDSVAGPGGGKEVADWRSVVRKVSWAWWIRGNRKASPLDAPQLLVDARSGALLSSWSGVLEAGVDLFVETQYSGQVSVRAETSYRPGLPLRLPEQSGCRPGAHGELDPSLRPLECRVTWGDPSNGGERTIFGGTLLDSVVPWPNFVAPPGETELSAWFDFGAFPRLATGVVASPHSPSPRAAFDVLYALEASADMFGGAFGVRLSFVDPDASYPVATGESRPLRRPLSARIHVPYGPYRNEVHAAGSRVFIGYVDEGEVYQDPESAPGGDLPTAMPTIVISDGDANLRTPVTPELVAHEVAHFVVMRHGPRLAPFGEPAAVHEAYADAIGVALRHYLAAGNRATMDPRTSATYLPFFSDRDLFRIGDRLFPGGGFLALRSFEHPSELDFRQPETWFPRIAEAPFPIPAARDQPQFSDPHYSSAPLRRLLWLLTFGTTDGAGQANDDGLGLQSVGLFHRAVMRLVPTDGYREFFAELEAAARWADELTRQNTGVESHRSRRAVCRAGQSVRLVAAAFDCSQL